MSLPASLLAVVEAHPCFTGCYDHGSPITLAVDPAARAVKSYDASCEDCLSFHVGALGSLLPAGYDHYHLARELSAHMRQVRGYTWAISGYHVSSGSNPGFWLSAASFGNGILLADASRNHPRAKTGGSDLDYLIRAFKEGRATSEHPRMLEPRLYSSEVVHLRLDAPLGVVRSKQDILNASQCSRSPKTGYQRVSLLEFLPLLQATAPASVAAAGSVAAAPIAAVATSAAPDEARDDDERPLALGERCPRCGAEVKQRQLLTEFFVGCLC